MHYERETSLTEAVKGKDEPQLHCAKLSADKDRPERESDELSFNLEYFVICRSQFYGA